MQQPRRYRRPTVRVNVLPSPRDPWTTREGRYIAEPIDAVR